MKKAWALLPFIAAVSLDCHGEVPVADSNLQTLKLKQEIRELELKNDALSSWSGRYGSLITILLALGTLGGTAIKTLSEYQKNREERRDENQRRADERFSSTVEKLASDSGLPAMMTAATSLLIFLKPEYPHLHEQVFRVMLAALKVDELPNPVKKILVHGFEKAIAVNLKSWKLEAIGLDWAGAYFRRIRLNELDLADVDIAFSDLRHANLGKSSLYRAKGIGAHLEDARLSGCNLQEARLREVYLNNANLHDANLVSARLEYADLQGAQFNRASLQDAHLDGANLKGACLVQANLKNARFCGAQFDESALKTVLKAYNNTWKKAVFDEEVWKHLCKEAGFSPENHTTC
ncbi:MAG TPA: pentapeptide repeat-containing protein [Burkholderiales bacterium]|nr:pentapeptide repeat-containing protein [Burkholderiales bacterium]